MTAFGKMHEPQLQRPWRKRPILLLLLCLLVWSQDTTAFVPRAATTTTTARLKASSDEQQDKDSHLNDLTPPLINWRRESILFGDRPATQKNNNALRLWRKVKSSLPPVVTGAYKKTTADANPMGALFNMLFIRIPILAAGILYVVNLATGHPLIMDVGYGPFEVSPIIVGGVLYLMLL